MHFPLTAPIIIVIIIIVPIIIVVTIIIVITIISSLPNGPTSSPGLGDLLRRELKEKKFLSMEKPQNRIVSKKGNVNIGKTKLSKR